MTAIHVQVRPVGLETRTWHQMQHRDTFSDIWSFGQALGKAVKCELVTFLKFCNGAVRGKAFADGASRVGNRSWIVEHNLQQPKPVSTGKWAFHPTENSSICDKWCRLGSSGQGTGSASHGIHLGAQPGKC